jgi:hypothetical protein
VKGRRAWAAFAFLAAAVLAGCGGGGGDAGTPALEGGGSSGSGGSTSGGTTTGANVQAISANSGPTGQFPNSLMTSVTICVPGTSTCQTIANVQVDTGSSGLRLLASAITIALPPVTAGANGGTYVECAGFADGIVWGSLAAADVKLGGETAASMSLQVIQDNGVGPAIPASCSAQGAPEDTQALLGANGLLGVGLFLQDCGTYCESNADTLYFVCASDNSCSGAAIPVAAQVSNPVAFFAQDNNGVILQLPSVPAAGAASAGGNMIFGIGTQANNSLAVAVIAVPDTGATAGAFTAVYQGASLTNSFFDSGSSGLYFDDPNLPACSAASPVGDLSGYYCPGAATSLSTVPISVTIVSSTAASFDDGESVANAQFLFMQPGAASLNIFDDLAGPAGPTLPDSFDFGVPFFFGKSVYTGFEQRTGPNGAGPYFAFQSYP